MEIITIRGIINAMGAGMITFCVMFMIVSYLGMMLTSLSDDPNMSSKVIRIGLTLSVIGGIGAMLISI